MIEAQYSTQAGITAGLRKVALGANVVFIP